MSHPLYLPLEVSVLRDRIAQELRTRQCSDEPGHYAQHGGGESTMYAVCGAVQIHAALGLPLGDLSTRQRWAERVLSYLSPSGRFEADGTGGPEHASCIALSTLHLLGQPIPSHLGLFVPLDAAALPGWLDQLDWGSTHKRLWGAVTPVLASGLADAAWTSRLVEYLASRIDPARPLETWCASTADPWRVISCIYHVTSTLDAGCVPYPHARLLLDRLLNLHWEAVDDDIMRTACTDGDWAWLLLRSMEIEPSLAQPIVQAIRRVSARRARAWQDDPTSVLGLGTFDLYCWLWSAAVFQHTCRDHFVGPFLRDTLNDPSLFRTSHRPAVRAG